MSPKSESKMRRRRSRALASAVGDLIQQSESLTTTTADGSYGSTTQGHSRDFCPATMHKPPYMDVQTVKTNLTTIQAAKLEGQSHCLLLVEPVLLPNLGHTGVDRETRPGDCPLFYPNGQKKCGMGTTLRNALYQSTALQPAGAVSAAQQQQRPPSDWAGSSAYHSLSSENDGSCFKSGFYSNNQHSDVESVSAAVPAGQGGRFPTDVWGAPPTDDTGSFNSTRSRERWRRKPPRSGGGSLTRHASESADSGSILDRRLARYAGRRGEEESRRRCSSHESLLAGRKAEVIRAQRLQQQLQQLQDTTDDNDSSRDIPTTAVHPQQGAEPPKTSGAKAHPSPTATTSTQRSYDHFMAAPAHKGGTSSSITSDWTTIGPSTTGRLASFDMAGRDSEWLAERRAADREAKEVLSALKSNSTRLHFLVGGG